MTPTRNSLHLRSELIFGAFNHDPKDGEERTFENWSPSGEPANLAADTPDGGYELVPAPGGETLESSGPAYWADHTTLNLAPGVTLRPGEINFFDNHWDQINTGKGVSTGPSMGPDGELGTEPIVPGTRYRITVSEYTGYEFGGKFRINWLIGPLNEAKHPTYTEATKGSTYQRLYSADDALLEPGVPTEIIAQSAEFSIGVCNIY